MRTKAEVLAELSKIEAEEQRLKSLPRPNRLAEQMHEETCHLDHVEMCGWYYEANDNGFGWEGYTHKRYLRAAYNILRLAPGLDDSLILQIITLAKEAA